MRKYELRRTISFHGLSGAKADWKHGPEHDRELPEDLPRVALAYDRLDPVGLLESLDTTIEQDK